MINFDLIDDVAAVSVIVYNTVSLWRMHKKLNGHLESHKVTQNYEPEKALKLDI